MPRFFADITGEKAFITGKDAKHIAGPLRKHTGDELLIRSGTEGFKSVITGMSRDGIVLEVVERQELHDRGRAKVHLGVSLIDMKEMDDIVRFASELGVKSIRPLIAERSNIRTVSASRLERWRDMIMESVKQSQQKTLPVLEPVSMLPDFVKTSEPVFRNRYYASIDGETGIMDIADDELCLLIGPEGGFTENETGLFGECGFMPVNMGKTILRTLAAAIAAASILCTRN